MKISVKYILVFLTVIILSNVPPFRGIIKLILFPERTLWYSTQNHGFTDFEYVSKGRDLQVVRSSFERYKRCQPADTILYRTFKPEAWRFWMWTEYATHPRYSYPYLPVSDGHEFTTLGRKSDCR